jgi:orotate phosphoribosyltransferase
MERMQHTAETSSKDQLRALLQEKSVCHGEFTLASGAKSDFYIDARVTTLDPRGACLIGEIGWALVKTTAAELNKKVNAIGGLTFGADPIALSIGIASQRENPAATTTPLQVFTVRKAVKEHGRQKRIEGNFAPGAIEEADGHVAFVLVLVDRQEGGRENIEKRGHKVVSIFTRADLN